MEWRRCVHVMDSAVWKKHNLICFGGSKPRRGLEKRCTRGIERISIIYRDQSKTKLQPSFSMPDPRSKQRLTVEHSVFVLLRVAIDTGDRTSVLTFLASFAMPVSPVLTLLADATMPRAFDLLKATTAEGVIIRINANAEALRRQSISDKIRISHVIQDLFLFFGKVINATRRADVNRELPFVFIQSGFKKLVAMMFASTELEARIRRLSIESFLPFRVGLSGKSMSDQNLPRLVRSSSIRIRITGLFVGHSKVGVESNVFVVRGRLLRRIKIHRIKRGVPGFRTHV
mmetsp:Transcript_21247/g.52337  ORF Transcript_21247/g.52337 Transcript_21247/m.52337 type:complete len:287 (+) Transcript_21247:286-1146(+)